MKSRELVLDAAERVMAEHGFEAAAVARVVAEAGIPLSSVYHYYGSEDGTLLAVMEQNAEPSVSSPIYPGGTDALVVPRSTSPGSSRPRSARWGVTRISCACSSSSPPHVSDRS